MYDVRLRQTRNDPWSIQDNQFTLGGGSWFVNPNYSTTIWKNQKRSRDLPRFAGSMQQPSHADEAAGWVKLKVRCSSRISTALPGPATDQQLTFNVGGLPVRGTVRRLCLIDSIPQPILRP